MCCCDIYGGSCCVAYDGYVVGVAGYDVVLVGIFGVANS